MIAFVICTARSTRGPDELRLRLVEKLAGPDAPRIRGAVSGDAVVARWTWWTRPPINVPIEGLFRAEGTGSEVTARVGLDLGSIVLAVVFCLGLLGIISYRLGQTPLALVMVIGFVAALQALVLLAAHVLAARAARRLVERSVEAG
jgi:hypothetical protein